MKRIAAMAATAVLLAVSAAHAQDDTDGPSFVPVETYTCNYNEGKGPADLDAALENWNEYMDGEGVGNYFGALVTPMFHGEATFAVGWIGAWPDGNQMGEGTDVWLEKGGEAGAGILSAITCDSHSLFATTRIRAGDGENDDDDSFVMSFSNCSARDGVDLEKVMEAQAQWAQYQTENGFSNGTWMMFPVFGESNNDYDFKSVEAHNNYTALGADFQKMAEGHWMKSSELFDPLLKCDIARVYNARVVREMDDE